MIKLAFLVALATVAASAEINCPFYKWSQIPHESECSKYYVCFLGRVSLATCPLGLDFDVVAKECRKSSEVNCRYRASKPTCPPGETVLIPHETYCSMFYSCDDGQQIELPCANGTEFYPELQMCDWPRPDGCWGSSTSFLPPTTEDVPATTEDPATTTEPTTEAPTTLEPTTEAPTTLKPTTEAPTTLEPTTEAPTTLEPTTEAPTTLEPTTLAPTTLEPTTPEPTTLEPTTVKPTTLEPTTEEPTTLEPTTAKPTTLEPTTQVPTTVAPTTTTQIPETTTPSEQVCPPNSGTIILVPHPTNCSQFYICFGGQGSLFECDSGFEFSEDAQGCVEISENGCTAQQNPPTTTTVAPTTTTIAPTTTPTTTSAPTTSEAPLTTIVPDVTTSAPSVCENLLGIVLVPHPTNCSMFYVCFANQGTLFECDAGFEFSEDVQDCVEISEDGCTAKQNPPTTSVAPTTEAEASICPSSLSITIVPSKTNCSEFYICINGNPQLLECDFGQEFSPEEETCVAISSNGCTAQQNGGQIPTSICPDTHGLAIIPDLSRCDTFHICSDGHHTELTCDPGMEFDKEILACTPLTPTGCYASKKERVKKTSRILKGFFGKML